MVVVYLDLDSCSIRSCPCGLQEYCVNQSTAIKVLQSLRENNPELASHLQVSLYLLYDIGVTACSIDGFFLV